MKGVDYMKKNRSSEFIGFRVPKGLKKELEEEAYAMNISLSSYLKLLLQGQVTRGDKK